MVCMTGALKNPSELRKVYLKSKMIIPVCGVKALRFEGRLMVTCKQGGREAEVGREIEVQHTRLHQYYGLLLYKRVYMEKCRVVPLQYPLQSPCGTLHPPAIPPGP